MVHLPFVSTVRFKPGISADPEAKKSAGKSNPYIPWKASEMMLEIVAFPGKEIEGGYVIVIFEDVTVAEIEDEVGYSYYFRRSDQYPMARFERGHSR